MTEAPNTITKAVINGIIRDGMGIEEADGTTLRFLTNVLIAYLEGTMTYAAFATGYELARVHNGDDVERYAERLIETVNRLNAAYEEYAA